MAYRLRRSYQETPARCVIGRSFGMIQGLVGPKTSSSAQSLSSTIATSGSPINACMISKAKDYVKCPLDLDELTPEAQAARMKLERVIAKMMQPPLSAAARVEVDTFGKPVKP